MLDSKRKVALMCIDEQMRALKQLHVSRLKSLAEEERLAHQSATFINERKLLLNQWRILEATVFIIRFFIENMDSEVFIGSLGKFVLFFQIERFCYTNAFKIYAMKEEILLMVSNNPVSNIKAESGTGKSVCLPLMILPLAAPDCSVLHIVRHHGEAHRCCSYLNEICFESQETLAFHMTCTNEYESAKIVYMTYRFMLLYMVTDPHLLPFSLIILDDVDNCREWAVNIIAFLKLLMNVRRNLKIILAGRDISSFDTDDRNSLLASPNGRLLDVHHVTHGYVDPINYYRIVVDKITDVLKNTSEGNILTYLVSSGDCLSVSKLLMRMSIPKVYLFHDYMNSWKINVKDTIGQRVIFLVCDSKCASKCFPGIKYVIDVGLREVVTFDEKLERYILKFIPISKQCASDRRKVLDTRPEGICYRLYNKKNSQEMKTSDTVECFERETLFLLFNNLRLSVPMYSSAVLSMKGKRKIAAICSQYGWLKYDQISQPENLSLMLITDLYIASKIVKCTEDKHMLLCAILYYCFLNLTPMHFWGGQNTRSNVKFHSVMGDVYNSISTYFEWLETKDKNKFFHAHFIDRNTMQFYHTKVLNAIRVLKGKGIPVDLPSVMLCEETLKKFGSFYLNEHANLMVQRVARHLSSYKTRDNTDCYPHVNSIYYYEKDSKLIPHMLMHYGERYLMLHVTHLPEDCHIRGSETADMETIYTYKEVGPLGTHFLKNFGETILENQKRFFQTILNDNYSSIEIDMTRGIIVLIYHREKEGEFLLFFENFIKSVEDKKSELREEFRKVPFYSADGFQTNVIGFLGSGCILYDVINPEEFVDIIIEKELDCNVELENTLPLLESYGKILKYSFAMESNKRSLQVTFMDSNIAKNVVDNFPFDDMYVTTKRSHPDNNNLRTTEHQEKPNATYSLEISWQWANHCSFAIINFETSEAYEEARAKLNGKLKLFTHTSMCTITPSSKKYSLSINGIPLGVTQFCLSMALKFAGIVSSYNLFFPLSRHDEPVEVAFEKASKAIKSFLKENAIGEFEIHFGIPPGKSKMFNARLSFRDEEDKLTVEGLLSNKALCLSKYPINTSKHIGIRLPAMKIAQEVILRELDTLQAKYRPLAVCIGIIDKRGVPNVSAIGDDKECVSEALIEIRNLVNGKIIRVNDEEKSLLDNPFGRKLILEIGRESGVFIKFDSEELGIRIIGRTENIETAETRINRLLQKLQEEQVKDIDLSANVFKKGIIKKLIHKYGYNLRKLQCSGLSSVLFDIKKKRIYLRGSSAAYDEVLQCIQSISETITDSCMQSSVDTCGLCFDDLNRNSVYRLHSCTHPFCMECLLETVEYHYKEKKVPIVCPFEGCEEHISFPDLKEISPQKDPGSLLGAARNLFIRNNDDIVECPGTDCPGILKLHKNQSECFVCRQKFCLQCKHPAHPGVACAILQHITNNDKGLIDWIAISPTTRKLCGRCKAPVEKISGCNHMTCPRCFCHFCWSCLKVFPTGNDVYNHQASCTRDIVLTQ